MNRTMAQQQQSFEYYQMPQMPQSMSPPELSPLSFYDTQGDFSADSAPSRGSPVSPVFPVSSFQLPSGTDWPAYFEKPTLSPDLDVFYGEAFGSPMSFFSTQNLTLSPSANPSDLMSDTVTFGREGINDTQPLFQTLDTVVPRPAAAAQPQIQTQPERQPQPQQSKSPRLSAPASRPEEQQPQQQLQQRTRTQTQQQQQQRQHQQQLRTSPRTNDLKRKSSASSASSRSGSGSGSPEPPARKTKHSSSSEPSKNPHNMIEKRYRVNINEKIVALRDAVPSLRCVIQQQSENPQGAGAAAGEGSDEPLDVIEELGGLMPARKLNKATILSKATEYIVHLEKKNGQLWRENQDLEKRLADVQRWQQQQQQQQQRTQTQVEAGGPYWS